MLFAEDDPAQPLLEYRLDPRVNKTWNVWHCRFTGQADTARYYAYRIDGPRPAGPGKWHAYDPQKVLLDPSAKEVFFPPAFDREAARQPGSNLGRAPLGVLPAPGRSPHRTNVGSCGMCRAPWLSTRCTSADSLAAPPAASRPT